MTCIGEPISWLRLERWALTGDRAIDDHLAACPACRACADQLRGDVVELRPLIVPVRARPWWLRWQLSAFVVAAAAVIAVLWLRVPTPGEVGEVDTRVARVKGIGAVTIGLVRDRDGAIRDDVTTYRAGDRWKLAITCPPGATALTTIAVAITDRTTGAVDHPLAAAELACGNGVVVPGAFAITGAADNRVCVEIAGGRGGDAGRACVTLRPEP